MISKKDLKYFSSLKEKKIRSIEKKFIVEGNKTVFEAINSNYPCEIILMTFQFAVENPNVEKILKQRKLNFEIISYRDFYKLADTKNPQGIIGIFKAKSVKISEINSNSKIIVFIDEVSDPGNLGTILRNCDWFGIKDILISYNSTDYLNPKVIRASMGSIFHLNIFNNISYDNIYSLKKTGYKIIISDLVGKNIFNFSYPEKFIITFSSESKGASKNLKSIADESVTIPKYGNAESLNVGVVSGIILSILTKS